MMTFAWLFSQWAERKEQRERMEVKVRAFEDTSLRLVEAHAYCQKYLMPLAWGENVWHAVLDDAVLLRAQAAALLTLMEINGAYCEEYRSAMDGLRELIGEQKGGQS